MSDKMVNEKSWEEFRDSGLAWWINSILHVFGWAIVFVIEEDKIMDCYPARVSFRGFDEDSTTDGFKKVSKYLKQNIDEIEKEANE